MNLKRTNRSSLNRQEQFGEKVKVRRVFALVLGGAYEVVEREWQKGSFAVDLTAGLEKRQGEVGLRVRLLLEERVLCEMPGTMSVYVIP